MREHRRSRAIRFATAFPPKAPELVAESSASLVWITSEVARQLVHTPSKLQVLAAHVKNWSELPFKVVAKLIA